LRQSIEDKYKLIFWQCDAEAFAEMYAQQPTWIEAIMLRRDPVTPWPNYCGIAALLEIFSKVPKNIFCVFSDTEPGGAYLLVNRLKTDVVDLTKGS